MPQPLCRRSAGPLAALLLAVGALAPGPLAAQLSPNCRRNGQPVACALTPGESDGQRSVVTVVFADHDIWRLEKDESRCRHTHPLSTCPAVLSGGPAGSRPLAGEYRGTWYEGGYRHDWSAPGIRIEYVFMD